MEFLNSICAIVVISFLSFASGNTVDINTDQCPIVCPALYSPVCATNGKIYKEFSNLCELTVSNCRKQRTSLDLFREIDMDWCTSQFSENLMEKIGTLDLTPSCLKPCPMIYEPVCVSNGINRGILSNICQMDVVNCVLKFEGVRNFKMLKSGSC